MRVERQANVTVGNPVGPTGLPSSSSSGASGGPQGSQQVVAMRTLARTPSIPDASAAEMIATHTKRLFGLGKLTGGESNHECVEFWMRQMRGHLVSLRAKKQDLKNSVCVLLFYGVPEYKVLFDGNHVGTLSDQCRTSVESVPLQKTGI